MNEIMLVIFVAIVVYTILSDVPFRKKTKRMVKDIKKMKGL